VRRRRGFLWRREHSSLVASHVPLLALGSAVSWGSGDYVGGLASRRGSVHRVTVASQLIGLVLLSALAVAMREALVWRTGFLWAIGAGLAGGAALLALWRSLAIAPMGIGAPVAAVVSGALPVIAGIVVEGAPSVVTMAGFALALGGIWLVSRTRDVRGREGFALALLAGSGFGLYYVLIDRAVLSGIFWPLVAGRVASFSVVSILAAVAGELRPPGGRSAGLALLSGVFDVGGNVLFVLAAAAGRLDVASVLASLYPAMTVALARVALKERLARHQALGAAAILVAIPLIV